MGQSADRVRVAASPASRRRFRLSTYRPLQRPSRRSSQGDCISELSRSGGNPTGFEAVSRSEATRFCKRPIIKSSRAAVGNWAIGIQIFHRSPDGAVSVYQRYATIYRLPPCPPLAARS